MKRTILFTLLTLWAGVAIAQKIVEKSGDASVLKGQTQVNVEYDYSSFGVGKFATEQEYLDKKYAEYEAEEAGKGKRFKESWLAARKNRYHPKFEELINKGMAGKKMTFGEYPDAKYTLIVKTTFVEIGFNVGVMKKPASVSFQYDIVETANRGKVLASMTQNNVPGSQMAGFDYDVGSRVAESYAKGGKMLAKLLGKKLK
ncbi:MAG: hypothetical protein IPJ06_16595 [Saprospiraceae bacterium]|nr:hypothetical protein [Saprospiraceae bacterium]